MAGVGFYLRLGGVPPAERPVSAPGPPLRLRLSSQEQSCDWVETRSCWDRERMSRPGWTARRIDEDGRRAVSGVWTYERTLKGSGCGGPWQASGLRCGYRPTKTMAALRKHRPFAEGTANGSIRPAAKKSSKKCQRSHRRKFFGIFLVPIDLRPRKRTKTSSV